MEQNKKFQISLDEEMCRQIIERFGLTVQAVKLIEESGELNTEIARYVLDILGVQSKGNMSAVAEEMADVIILLSQIMIKCGIKECVEEIIDLKLHRTISRIERGLY